MERFLTESEFQLPIKSEYQIRFSKISDCVEDLMNVEISSIIRKQDKTPIDQIDHIKRKILKKEVQQNISIQHSYMNFERIILSDKLNIIEEFDNLENEKK